MQPISKYFRTHRKSDRAIIIQLNSQVEWEGIVCAIDFNEVNTVIFSVNYLNISQINLKNGINELKGQFPHLQVHYFGRKNILALVAFGLMVVARRTIFVVVANDTVYDLFFMLAGRLNCFWHGKMIYLLTGLSAKDWVGDKKKYTKTVNTSLVLSVKVFLNRALRCLLIFAVTNKWVYYLRFDGLDDTHNQDSPEIFELFKFDQVVFLNSARAESALAEGANRQTLMDISDSFIPCLQKLSAKKTCRPKVHLIDANGSYTRVFVYTSNFPNQEFLFDLVCAAREIKAELLIKLHPSDDKSFYSPDVQNYVLDTKLSLRRPTYEKTLFLCGFSSVFFKIFRSMGEGSALILLDALGGDPNFLTDCEQYIVTEEQALEAITGN